MRLSGRLAGPMIGIRSFFLPWNRGEAVNARTSHTPTTTAPDRGNASSAKLIFMGPPRASDLASPGAIDAAQPGVNAAVRPSRATVPCGEARRPETYGDAVV